MDAVEEIENDMATEQCLAPAVCTLQVGGRAVLVAVPAGGCLCECFGSVGSVIAGLANSKGHALLDGASGRMRALTGYARVTLTCGDRGAESNRVAFGGTVSQADLP